MTAWIDGSFIYSTSEAWLNAMRSFQNGSFLTDKGGSLPPRNTMRVPLFNHPLPHVMRMLSPERLFCEYEANLFIHNFYMKAQCAKYNHFIKPLNRVCKRSFYSF
jgi:hypothetical protein